MQYFQDETRVLALEVTQQILQGAMGYFNFELTLSGMRTKTDTEKENEMPIKSKYT